MVIRRSQTVLTSDGVVSSLAPERVAAWLSALETRHLAELTFSEVSRSVRALSSAYVARRSGLAQGAPLSGAGKRAAFALYYGPLHFLLVHHIVRSIGGPLTTVESLLDLGCGTGASGAAWALACERPPSLVGIDRHPWAVSEARRTCADLRVRATFRVDDLNRATVDGTRGDNHGRPRAAAPGRQRRCARGVLLAFAANELATPHDRERLLARLLDHVRAGGCVLVVEPLARAVAPWWTGWQRQFEEAGGRADEWRFALPLPAIVSKLDQATGLDHRELTARTLVCT